MPARIMQAYRPAFVLILLLSIANMVIYFGIAKNRNEKEQTFHNDCSSTTLKPLIITNLNQTIEVHSLISLHATYPVFYASQIWSASTAAVAGSDRQVLQAKLSQSDSVRAAAFASRRSGCTARHSIGGGRCARLPVLRASR